MKYLAIAVFVIAFIQAPAQTQNTGQQWEYLTYIIPASGELGAPVYLMDGSFEDHQNYADQLRKRLIEYLTQIDPETVLDPQAPLPNEFPLYLKVFGEEGWELAASTTYSSRTMLIFKRPK